MPIVIGGPPSSGSSLLSVVFDRHSRIRCIQESHILAKADLYKDWDRHKHRLKALRLPSPGWHKYSRIDVSSDDQEDLARYCQSAASFTEFVQAYFRHQAEKKHKEDWAEKTPANVYFFYNLSQLDLEVTCVLTIRNPYDTIASLVMRGKSILDAVALCLVNLAMGYFQSQQLRVLECKYEEFVARPQAYLRTLCESMGIHYEDRMLDFNPLPETTMKGWKNFEDGHISQKSVNRFSEITTNQQSEIIHLAQKLYANPAHIKQFVPIPQDQDAVNIDFLAKHFGYEIIRTPSQGASFRYPIMVDQLQRLLFARPSAKPYPLIYLSS